MGPDAIFTLIVVVLLFVALIKNLGPPDFLFLGATALFSLTGIVSPSEAFAGFSNPGMLTVGMLFVVAAGLKETGVLDFIGLHVFGGVQNEGRALLRLAVVAVPLSAFLNNTPIVAMFVPLVLAWCRQHHVSPSKLMMPLSFMTILGGTCTLIGTSTNLIVNGLMVDNGLKGMHLFEIGMVGLPYTIVGMAYLFFVSRHWLPDRKDLLDRLGETNREYVIHMRVEPECRLVGQSVGNSGLTHFVGLRMLGIQRTDATRLITPEEIIEANDLLVFQGVVGSIVEIEKIPGLVPVGDAAYVSSSKEQREKRLCEAVLSDTSPFIGKTIQESACQDCCDSAVIALHRQGTRLEKNIERVRLKAGDTLLLQTGPDFIRSFRNDPSFFLVSDVKEWRPLRRDKAWIAGLLFFVLIMLLATGYLAPLISAALVAVLMVGARCISAGDARRSIDWQVLITIASAFGVGNALHNSGAASAIASALVRTTDGLGPVAALAVIYLTGSVLTSLITNNAAAVLMFPLCIEAAHLFSVSPRPFLMALTLAASASFMTPIGYQTNLMVYGPGGYLFSDFLRIGAPLNALMWAVAVLLIPLIWSF
ncbi:MAG: SLC13 family permease [Deltaproteobacteria bacterium]|nr:SLC13 family permease [Deltaproteobacteria bacterium]